MCLLGRLLRSLGDGMAVLEHLLRTLLDMLP